MSGRCALLTWGCGRPSLPPPGVDQDAYAAALFEDVAELVHGLAGIDSLVVCAPGSARVVAGLVWPEVPVVELAEPTAWAAVALAAQCGYDEAVTVAGDAPDLPQLVLAKLFQALGRLPVAVAPADSGGAVAVGVRLPTPAWLPAVDLDSPDIVTALQRAGPGEVAVTPGWHRLRDPADVARLDPGLEGWEATRVLLSRLSSPRGA